MDAVLQNHPGWQWCTAEGAELHTLLMGLHSSFPEQLQWLEEAENLTLAMAASHEKMAEPPLSGEPSIPSGL